MFWSRSLGKRLQASPAGSHLLRAYQRYFNRFGNQLAAAMAFFSVVAIVPVLMFAFSAVGFTLTVIRPDLMGHVQIFIVDNLYAGPVQDQILILVSDYLYNWRRVGLFALVAALVIGSTWVANLKGVIRGMGRPDFDMVQRKRSFWLEPLINIVLLLGLLVLIALTFTATVIGTQLADTIVDWLRVSDVQISQALVQMASLTLSLAGATLLFWLIYRFLPEERAPNIALVRGSLGAGLCFVALQAAASWLTGLLSLGRATQVFGPVIVAMLFINIFAQLILFWAAWIATWNQPAIARRLSFGDQILRDQEDTVSVEDHWQIAESAQAKRALSPQPATGNAAGRLQATGRPVRIRSGASPVGRG